MSLKNPMIYLIINKMNGKYYVGSTGLGKSRWNGHRGDLNTGQGSPHLQAAWNKYGEDNFTFIILRRIDYTTDNIALQNTLRQQEDWFINFMESRNPNLGYNILSANGAPGYEHTAKTKKTLSEAQKGKTAWNKGLTKKNDKKLVNCGKLGQNKGRIPWNKGLTKKEDERLIKCGWPGKNKGKIPWNKGLKYSVIKN